VKAISFRDDMDSKRRHALHAWILPDPTGGRAGSETTLPFLFFPAGQQRQVARGNERRKEPRNGNKSLDKVLPAVFAENWTIQKKTDLFDKDTLFERINGEAELFFPCGFGELAAAEYGDPKYPDVPVTADSAEANFPAAHSGT